MTIINDSTFSTEFSQHFYTGYKRKCSFDSWAKNVKDTIKVAWDSVKNKYNIRFYTASVSDPSIYGLIVSQSIAQEYTRRASAVFSIIWSHLWCD